MLLTALSFQGNKKGIFKVNQTEAERREKGGKKSGNNPGEAITISQSQIIKIKTSRERTVEGEKMFRNKHPFITNPDTSASFSIKCHY